MVPCYIVENQQLVNGSLLYYGKPTTCQWFPAILWKTNNLSMVPCCIVENQQLVNGSVLYYGKPTTCQWFPAILWIIFFNVTTEVRDTN